MRINIYIYIYLHVYIKEILFTSALCGCFVVDPLEQGSRPTDRKHTRLSQRDSKRFVVLYLGVSKNRGIPKSSNSNRVFHYKPSILGYPYFWKHPIFFFATFLKDTQKTHTATLFGGGIFF